MKTIYTFCLAIYIKMQINIYRKSTNRQKRLCRQVPYLATPPSQKKVILSTAPRALKDKMSDFTCSPSRFTCKRLNPRESAKLISSKSRDVSICQQGIEEASKVIFDCIKSKKYSFKIWKGHDLHPSDMTKEALDWIVVLDTLNFSFWTDKDVEPWTVRFEGKNYTGYWALCAAINRALKVCIRPENVPFLIRPSPFPPSLPLPPPPNSPFPPPCT